MVTYHVHCCEQRKSGRGGEGRGEEEEGREGRRGEERGRGRRGWDGRRGGGRGRGRGGERWMNIENSQMNISIPTLLPSPPLPIFTRESWCTVP